MQSYFRRVNQVEALALHVNVSPTCAPEGMLLIQMPSKQGQFSFNESGRFEYSHVQMRLEVAAPARVAESLIVRYPEFPGSSTMIDTRIPGAPFTSIADRMSRTDHVPPGSPKLRFADTFNYLRA